MRATILVVVLVMGCRLALAQNTNAIDPDSLLAEWLEAGEWEGVSLHPDIALEWLMELDTSESVKIDRLAGKQMFTVNAPVHANVFDWISDSGNMISPVSVRYRLKVAESSRWEFRMQVHQNAGDTCLVLPDTGVPEQVSAGILIKPSAVFQEVILGDYQVNTGFGAVAGSSPVFSVSLGNPGSLHRPGKGIRLHSGTSEGRYFRGLAGSIKTGRSEILFYGSGKDGSNEEVTGLGWKRSFMNSEFGLSGIRIQNQFPPAVREGWSSVWQPDSGLFRRIGVSGQARVPFGILFGETGWSPHNGYGWITGFRLFEEHGFSAVIRYSGCSPGYPVTYTLFQSGSGLTKEGQRLIVSFRFAPKRSIEWLGSVEVERAQWPGSNARFNNPRTRIAQQVKCQSKNPWTAIASVQIDFVESEEGIPGKLTWKMAFDSDPKNSGPLRFRAGIRQQVQGFGANLTSGTTADCSLSATLFDRKLRITGGFRVFTVESGTDPLYAYEPDVLYGWSAPVLTGSGTRWFTAIRCQLLKNIDIELKINQTAYADLKHLSDGNSGGLSAKVQVSSKF